MGFLRVLLRSLIDRLLTASEMSCHLFDPPMGMGSCMDPFKSFSLSGDSFCLLSDVLPKGSAL